MHENRRNGAARINRITSAIPAKSRTLKRSGATALGRPHFLHSDGFGRAAFYQFPRPALGWSCRQIYGARESGEDTNTSRQFRKVGYWNHMFSAICRMHSTLFPLQSLSILSFRPEWHTSICVVVAVVRTEKRPTIPFPRLPVLDHGWKTVF